MALVDGFVTNAPDADRLGFAVTLFVRQLRADPRVQAASERWRVVHGLPALIAAVQSAETLENVVAFGEALNAEDQSDGPLVATLMADLGLAYDWLPQLLVAQFKIWAFNAARGINEELLIRNDPERLAARTWAAAGKRPKQKAGEMGGFRLENLERVIATFYRCEVQNPPIPKKRLATIEGRLRSDVQHDCKRARALLAGLVVVPPLEHRS